MGLSHEHAGPKIFLVAQKIVYLLQLAAEKKKPFLVQLDKLLAILIL